MTHNPTPEQGRPVPDAGAIAQPVIVRPPAPRPAPAGRGALIVLSTLLVLAVAATAVFATLYFTAGDEASGPSVVEIDELRESALAVADDVAVKVTSLSYRDFDAQRTAILEMGTERFADEYGGTLDGMRSVVTETRSVNTGTIRYSAVAEVDEQRATAIVFVNQTGQSTLAPEDVGNAARLLITLSRVDDRWLVDAISYP